MHWAHLRAVDQSYRIELVLPQAVSYWRPWLLLFVFQRRHHKEYAGASPKEIIRAEVKKQIKISEEQIPALKQDVDAWEKEAATLRLITVSDASFYIDKDFFGDQPKIKAKMINKSGYDISSAKYYAALYIDDQPDPVATSIVPSNYKSIGGV